MPWLDFDPLERMPPEEPGCFMVYTDADLRMIAAARDLRKAVANLEMARSKFGPGIITPWGMVRKIVIKVLITCDFSTAKAHEVDYRKRFFGG